MLIKHSREVTAAPEHFTFMLDLEVSVLAEALEMNEARAVPSVGRVESFKTSLAMQKQRLLRQTQVRLKRRGKV